MKILVFGGSGMLGHKLVQSWKEKFDVWTTVRGSFQEYEQFDIFEKKKLIENLNVNNKDEIEKIVKETAPEVIVNAVGVIKQLPNSKDVINTLEVNSIFPHRLKVISQQYNARLINIGTDCVFSGKKGNYNEEDVPDAEDLYGKSKNLGEVIASNSLTLRTSIIGRELLTRHSLVEWFLSNQGRKVKGFTNAVFSGFPTIILADILADIIVNHKNLTGLYHLSSQPINKYKLLLLLKSFFDVEIEIEPFEDFFIDRSLDSAKFKNATGFNAKGWNEMIGTMSEDNSEYGRL